MRSTSLGLCVLIRWFIAFSFIVLFAVSFICMYFCCLIYCFSLLSHSRFVRCLIHCSLLCPPPKNDFPMFWAQGPLNTLRLIGGLPSHVLFCCVFINCFFLWSHSWLCLLSHPLFLLSRSFFFGLSHPLFFTLHSKKSGPWAQGLTPWEWDPGNH